MLMPSVPNRYSPATAHARPDHENSHGMHASSASRWKPMIPVRIGMWARLRPFGSSQPNRQNRRSTAFIFASMLAPFLVPDGTVKRSPARHSRRLASYKGHEHDQNRMIR